MARIRNTRQKAAVLAAVQNAKHHPDAKWVYEQVSQEIPNISLGTVYRALASLSSEGQIQEYRQTNGPSLYDPNTDEHLHIHCNACGRIEDVPPVKLAGNVLESVCQMSAFARVDRVRLEFHGICSACADESHELRRECRQDPSG